MNLKNEVEYICWRGFINRCYTSKKPKDIRLIQNIGIKVADRWIKSYENFLYDVGRRPSPDHILKRINPDKDFCKENCKWMKRKEAAVYHRSNIIIDGQTLLSLSKKVNKTYNTLHHRFHKNIKDKETLLNSNRINEQIYNGENASNAGKRLGGGVTTVMNRIKKGWTIEQAFTEPVNKKYQNFINK